MVGIFVGLMGSAEIYNRARSNQTDNTLSTYLLSRSLQRFARSRAALFSFRLFEMRLLFPIFVSCACTKQFYVSPSGDVSQQSDGSALHPFGSLVSAMQAVRALKDSNGVLPSDVEVLLLPGTHMLTETLNLGPLDGGDGKHSIGFKPSDHTLGATISGGIQLGPWAQASSKTVSKTTIGTNKANSTSPQLWTASFPQALATDGSALQLWEGDTRLQLASSPTQKYTHANASFIVFAEHGDIRDDYHDFDHVQLLLYESWTASLHRMTSVNAANRTAFLAQHFNNKWANQVSRMHNRDSRLAILSYACLVDFNVFFYLYLWHLHLPLRRHPARACRPLALATLFRMQSRSLMLSASSILIEQQQPVAKLARSTWPPPVQI